MGKKRGCNSFALSLLLWAVPMGSLVLGSIICSNGIRVLAALDGGEDMNLAACHMLDSSKPSSHSVQ